MQPAQGSKQSKAEIWDPQPNSPLTLVMVIMEQEKLQVLLRGQGQTQEFSWPSFFKEVQEMGSN